jgi:hypothetical protein
MMSYIATVYKLGIEFVQDAAVYFARPTSRENSYFPHSAKIDPDATI